MERLILACGGNAVNSVDDLTIDDLVKNIQKIKYKLNQGYAEEVYEQSLGDDKYTFIEGVKFLKSCTILVKGPNEHTIAMIKVSLKIN